MTRILAVLAAAAMAAFLMPVAQAQQRLPCAPRDIVTAALAGKHGERPVLRGVAGSAMLEIWLNTESGTFSVIITQAASGGQLSCILTAGNSMSHVDEPIMPGKKS